MTINLESHTQFLAPREHRRLVVSNCLPKRPFLVTCARDIWDSPDRAWKQKMSKSWSQKVRPENGHHLAPFSSKVLLRCGRKVAALFGSETRKKNDPGVQKNRPDGTIADRAEANDSNERPILDKYGHAG